MNIAATYGHISTSPPILIADGRYQISTLMYAEWECACGYLCRCYEYVPLTMGFQCVCDLIYTVDWAHGLEPRVTLEEKK